MLRKVKKFLTKRRVMILSVCLVVFVMSLGYAALSQYIELDGIASIDRSWIVKVTNVTNTVTNSAENISSSYISNTVTLNANLPTSSSTITYTITLENQGNIKAKLNNIEVIEDENTNITYEISGVEEGVTQLNPGESNTATVTIRYKDGVTNTGNTEKRMMLTFIYIDNSGTNGSTGGSSGGTTEEEEYEVYEVGEKVTLVDGSIWYVTKDSGSNEDEVTLVSANTASSSGSVASNGTYTRAFDSNNTNEYDQYDSNNIGYFVKNTVEAYIKNSINNNGGNSTGTTARLLTKEEYDNITNKGQEIPSWMIGSFWLMSNEEGSNGYYFNGTSLANTSSFTSSYRVRPVIITLKSNIIPPVYLKDQILEDNVEQVDSSIDFSQISSSTNGQGLYYTNTNTENNQRTYYFRGNVTNNYVYFANFYWRIIRINEDGSVRLIYQGTTPDATGSATTIGSSAFNSNNNDNAYVGYMYGTPGSSSYSATHANTNDSTIKGVIDTWYEENLLDNYAIYLADSGFCGDRSIASSSGLWDSDDTALGYGTNYSSYGAYNRLYNNKTPQFACPQENDLYTTSSSTKGNKALDYPIGLITADEVAYAGGVYNVSNTSYYLYTGANYWTMSPRNFDGYYAGEWYVSSDGRLYNNYVNFLGRVARPAINLISGIEITGGDGTIGNEYIIKVS